MLAHNEPVETVPTIGLNVKVFKKGQVNMKCWDIGRLGLCQVDVLLSFGLVSKQISLID